MNSESGGRLGRWARRKAEVRQRRGGAMPALPEEPSEVPARGTEPPDEAQAAPPADNTTTREADLPDVESLGADSDFTVFMKDGVPAQLRRLALRKLWASDPMFNVIDEMVEYGEDYTDAATVVAGMKSAWEAGRGYAGKKGERDESDAAATETDVPDEAGDRDVDTAAEGQTAADDDPADGETRENG